MVTSSVADRRTYDGLLGFNPIKEKQNIRKTIISSYKFNKDLDVTSKEKRIRVAVVGIFVKPGDSSSYDRCFKARKVQRLELTFEESLNTRKG